MDSLSLSIIYPSMFLNRIPGSLFHVFYGQPFKLFCLTTKVIIQTRFTFSTHFVPLLNNDLFRILLLIVFFAENNHQYYFKDLCDKISKPKKLRKENCRWPRRRVLIMRDPQKSFIVSLNSTTKYLIINIRIKFYMQAISSTIKSLSSSR